MSYTVLARRYRPETFDEVVGQEAIAKTLKNAITLDRVAHAYIFTGTRGVGKTTMARILAKALNCMEYDGPTATPCCKCESCLAISEGDDIDVLEIDGASNTGVEHIRELRQNAIYRPARSRMKIYIIDEVHMLSTSAFNALLKTLEEPPEHVKFIFATTEPNKILPTIQSRCQRFDFRNVQLDDIAAHLKSVLQGEVIEADDAVLRRIARLARGSIRDGLSLLDQLLSMSHDGKVTMDALSDLTGTPRSDRLIALVDALAQGDLGQTLNQLDMALGEGLALEQLAQALQGHFRDLMVLRNCGEQTDLVDADEAAVRQKLVEQAKLFDDPVLVFNITVMEELRRAIKSSGSGRALLEAAMVRLTATDRFGDTKVLLDQLRTLQATGAAPAHRAATPTAQRPTATQPQRTSYPPANTAAKNSPQNNSSNAPANISLDYLKKNWPKIITDMSNKGARHLEMMLKPAQPTAWQNGQLTLAFDPAGQGMKKLLTDQPGALAETEKALAAVLKTALKIRLTDADTAAPRPPATKPDNATPVKKKLVPPGARPSQQEINAAINDPKVKSIQQVLGGKVLQVDRKTQP